MATINSKKLLPSSKKGGAIESQKFLVPIKSISVKKISASALKPLDKKEVDGSGNLVVVRKKIIKLKDIVNNSLLIDRKDTSNKRKEEERNKAEQRERKIEEKVKKNNVSQNLIPTIPGQSLFDKINRFIGFTLLGYLFNKYGELLPKLLEFGKVLEPVGKFVEGFAKNILKGVVDFVEFGYKAYDQTRDFVKQIGGQGAQKTFDDFSKNLNLLLNGAIGAAMLIASTSSGKSGRPGAPGKMPGGNPSTLPKSAKLSAYLGRDPQTKFIERKYGNDAARMYEARKSQGASVSRARADVVKRFEKFEGTQRGLAGGTGKGGIFSRGFGKSLNRSSLKVLGRGGTKLAKGALGRVPIVGGLLNFAFALAMGENPGRAAAKAVGSTVGAALGTFIPVPFAGTILGGILGDIVGGAMYDTLVSSKQKPQGRAQGGTITRGGQSSSSPSRQLKTKPRKVAPKITPQKTEPGRNIGGKIKIEELYGKDEPGKRSALRALKKSSDDVKKMRSLNGLSGAMFGAGIDMALGQKPDKKLATSLGNMFGSVIQTAIDSELSTSFNDISKTLAMSNGGVVPSREIGRQLSIGEKIGKFISNSLTASIESSASKILQNLNRELNLEGGPGDFSTPNPSSPGSTYRIDAGAGGSPELRSEVAKAAAELGVPAPDLLGVILAESGGDPAKTNQFGCTGLIQFCPGGGQAVVGKTGDQLRRMSIKEQMIYVVKYLKAAGVKPGMSGYDIYSAIHAGRPGGNITDRNGVTTRGFYQSNVRPLIERAKVHSQVISSPTTMGSTTGVPLTETSQYGWRWGRQHWGIDLQSRSGWQNTIHLPVVVKKPGVVEFAGIAGKNMGTVEIRHPDGSLTRYLHLNGFKVKTGDNVRAGQVIARIAGEGESGYGNATGPHLHFEYYPHGGGPINPKDIYTSYVSLGGSTSVSPQQLSTPPPRDNLPPSPSSRGSGRPSLNLPGLGLKRNPRTGIWEKASLAPTQSSTVASLNKSGLLNTDTSVLIIENNSIALQMIEVPTSSVV